MTKVSDLTNVQAVHPCLKNGVNSYVIHIVDAHGKLPKEAKRSYYSSDRWDITRCNRAVSSMTVTGFRHGDR